MFHYHSIHIYIYYLYYFPHFKWLNSPFLSISIIHSHHFSIDPFLTRCHLPARASHVSNGSSGGAGEAGPGSGTAWAAWVVVPSFFFGNFGWNMKDTWCFFGEENIHTSYMYILYIHNLTCFYDSWKGGTECIGIVGQNGHPPVRYWYESRHSWNDHYRTTGEWGTPRTLSSIMQETSWIVDTAGDGR